MTSRDFCYWLQGWFELNSTIDHREGASKETLEMIQKHLNLVFYHEIDPSYSSDPKKQEEMLEIHVGKPEKVEVKPLRRSFARDGKQVKC